jgi:hypothetical protein
MSIKIEGLEELQKALDPKMFDKVFRATANEIVNGAFKKSHTQIKKKWNIDIKKEDKNDWAFAHKTTGKTNKRNGRMRIYRATQKDNSIYIHISGTPINLSLFEYTWNMEVQSKKTFKAKKRVAKQKSKLNKVSQGKVRVKIKKNEITTFKNAFVATMKNNHKGIFQRSSKSSLPILEKRIISAPSMFEQVNFKRILEQDVNDKMVKRFTHHLNRYSKGYWK